jgi:hypothetical protein
MPKIKEMSDCRGWITVSIEDSLCTLVFRGWKSPKEAETAPQNLIFLKSQSLRRSGAYSQLTANNTLIHLRSALFWRTGSRITSEYKTKKEKYPKFLI